MVEGKYSYCLVCCVLKKVPWKHGGEEACLLCEVMPDLNLEGQVGVSQAYGRLEGDFR